MDSREGKYTTGKYRAIGYGSSVDETLFGSSGGGESTGGFGKRCGIMVKYAIT
jgi:hypothetical protein